MNRATYQFFVVGTATFILIGNKLMQNKGQINLKRRFNSVAVPWAQFNYNIIFKINGKIIDINTH